MPNSPKLSQQPNTSSTLNDSRRPQYSETILLVEDEQSLRVLAALFLGRQGYTVLQASAPDEAIQVAERQSGEIHLLLTDVTLPGMNGYALAQRLQKQRASLKVLYVSGYPEEILQQLDSPTDEHSFLEKPFTLEALARKIRELLDPAQESTGAEMLAAG